MTKNKQIQELLPQATPMLMVDTLISSDNKKTVTEFTVTKNNIFIENDKLTEPGIIENMAQTAAARAGYEALEKNKPVKKGFIASIKNLKIYDLPKINKTIKTILTPVNNIGNISVVKIQSFVNKNPLAECILTVILED